MAWGTGFWSGRVIFDLGRLFLSYLGVGLGVELVVRVG